MLSFKVLTRRKFWDKLILGTNIKLRPVIYRRKRTLVSYIGRRGEALTILRPVGAVLLEDGTKLDVVTDGGFIQKGKQVEVIRAEGVSLVVREVNETKRNKELRGHKVEYELSRAIIMQTIS